MLYKIGIFALISLTIYFGIAAGLIISDRPQPLLATASEQLAFDALDSVNYTEMPELQPYTARDGATLHYRHYQSDTTDADEAFIAEAYEPTITAQTDEGTYQLLPDLGHIDLLTDEALFEVTSSWLSDLH